MPASDSFVFCWMALILGPAWRQGDRTGNNSDLIGDSNCGFMRRILHIFQQLRKDGVNERRPLDGAPVDSFYDFCGTGLASAS